MNIEVITTNNRTLKETGFGLHASCLDVLEAVKRTGNKVRLTVCESILDLENVVARAPDMVFLAAKYLTTHGENLWFSDYFSKHNITFSGSNRQALEFDSNKVLAKLHLEKMGIKTARHFTATPTQYLSRDALPLSFPLFVKPMDAANGNGIDDLSFVNSFAEFTEKVLSIYTLYKQPALVEEYLSGREFTVSIMCNGQGSMTASSIEIVPPESSHGLRILGSLVKQGNTESLIKMTDNADTQNVNELAKSAFLGLGARGFGRIDVKMNNHGRCFFMEANLVPGMTRGTSYFPNALEIADDLDYDAVVCLMLEECQGRIALEKACIDMAILTTAEVLQ